MLIGNYSVLQKTPGLWLSGSSISDNRSNWNKSGMQRAMYYVDRDAHFAFFNGIPNGTVPPYSWFIPEYNGGMAIYETVFGSGSLANGNLAGGLNGVAALTGSGDIISATGQLIVSAVAVITGSGSLSGNILAALLASANLAGSGDITSSLIALGNAVSLITGSGGVSASTSGTATGTMSADITSQSTLSPDSLASAVWNSVAAQFNTIGTFGHELNAAGAGGDPWATNLPGGYTGTEAGAILAQIQTLIDELHKIGGLDVANPMTASPTSRASGSIDLSVSGYGTALTTVQRL